MLCLCIAPWSDFCLLRRRAKLVGVRCNRSSTWYHLRPYLSFRPFTSSGLFRHRYNTGNGHDFNFDVWRSHIFSYMPVASSQCVGFNVDPNGNCGLVYVSVLPWSSFEFDLPEGPTFQMVSYPILILSRNSHWSSACIQDVALLVEWPRYVSIIHLFTSEFIDLTGRAVQCDCIATLGLKCLFIHV
jgi:hypothetical protein